MDTVEKEKVSKSARLRKYGSVYKKHVKPPPSPPKRRQVPHRESRRHTETEAQVSRESTSRPKPKKLNDYQKFVKKESRKEKYTNMKGSERLNAIAAEWEHFKKKESRKKKEKKDVFEKKTY